MLDTILQISPVNVSQSAPTNEKVESSLLTRISETVSKALHKLSLFFSFSWLFGSNKVDRSASGDLSERTSIKTLDSANKIVKVATGATNWSKYVDDQLALDGKTFSKELTDWLKAEMARNNPSEEERKKHLSDLINLGKSVFPSTPTTTVVKAPDSPTSKPDLSLKHIVNQIWSRPALRPSMEAKVDDVHSASSKQLCSDFAIHLKQSTTISRSVLNSDPTIYIPKNAALITKFYEQYPDLVIALISDALVEGTLRFPNSYIAIDDYKNFLALIEEKMILVDAYQKENSRFEMHEIVNALKVASKRFPLSSASNFQKNPYDLSQKTMLTSIERVLYPEAN